MIIDFQQSFTKDASVNSAFARMLGSTASLVAVFLWLGAAGWHGALHPNHAGVADHPADCSAAHHAPHPSRGDGAGIGSAALGAVAGDAAQACLACVVASSTAVQSDLQAMPALHATHDATVQADTGVLSSAPLGAFRLRGPPA